MYKPLTSNLEVQDQEGDEGAVRELGQEGSFQEGEKCSQSSVGKLGLLRGKPLGCD